MRSITKYCSIAVLTLSIIVLASCGSKEQKQATPKSEKQNIAVDTALQSKLNKFATKPRCKGNFGLYVYDITADKVVYANNEHQLQPSASCMKLLSGVAGLHQLGVNYKYHSAVYTNGSVKGDTLHGDIAFKGDLDPQLTPAEVKDMAHIMKQLKGFKTFTGKFYIDILMPNQIQKEQHWYDYDLTLSKFSILFRGKDFVERTLKTAFRQEGFKFNDDQIVFAPLPRTSHCVRRLNRDISMVIRRMWKNSANTQATSLLYTIGYTANPKNPDYASSGIAYMKQFMKNELKSTEKGIVIHDGCGLCTQDQLTPYFLCEILRYGYAHKDIYNMLYQFLAVSGQDGTLRRWPQTMKEKVRAKTGTLSHPYGISSLAGYARGNNGHLLCFAIMDSEMSVLDAHVLQKDLCEILVSDPNNKKLKK